MIVPKTQVLSGWGMANRARSEVYAPRDAAEVAEAVADARRRGLTIAARGAGLSYGDAALNQGGAVVDVSGLRDILDFDAEDGVVRAQAGVTIADVWARVLPSGWWPPVVPGTMKATLGGCVAMNVHGKNHVEAGPLGRHVEGVTLVDGDGRQRHVRRDVSVGDDGDAGGSSLRDIIGAQGLTGIITEVTLRLGRVHSGYLAVEALPTRSLPETFEAVDRGAVEATHSVAWLDCVGGGRGVVHHGREIPPGHALSGKGLSARDQALPARVAGVLPRAQAWRALRVFMSRPGIRLLNGGKYGAARLRGPHTYHQTHAAFHFLLDYVPDWKRAYGPGGLLQYQMFVPAAAAPQAFADALREQRRLGVVSYLAVLKRHTASASAASYLVDGYSLALDFPVSRGPAYGRLMRLCRSLGQILADHDGRLYAAKDAVGTGRLPETRDPAFSSNLVRRWERGPA